MPMNARLLRPRAIENGFDPSTLANLEIWLDARKTSTYDVTSGQVSEWRSAVGSRLFSQATANNRPTLFESSSDSQGSTVAAINGRQAVYFDGTNDVMAGSSAISFQQYTAFAVCRSDRTTSVQVLFGRDPGGGTSGRGPQLIRHSNAGVVQAVGFGTAASFTADAGTMTSGVAAVIHARQNSSEVVTHLNNVAGTAVAGVQNSSNTTPFLGGRSTTGELWRGVVGEVLLYARALPAQDMSTVYTYLARKWGIA